jgi:tryptophan synthase alpha chain
MAAGFDGAVVPDLPAEEAGVLKSEADSRDFKLISLVAPTTPDDRMRSILANGSGFVYAISVTGITGERSQLPADLSRRISHLRTQTTMPICVGFGISTAEQVAQLKGQADGVIVGSALVKKLPRAKTAEGWNELVSFARTLMTALQ